jgi:hypothetical protein
MKKNIEEILKDGAGVVETRDVIYQALGWIGESLRGEDKKEYIEGWVAKIQRCLNGLQDYSRKYPDSRFVKTNIRDIFSNFKGSLPKDTYDQIRKSYRAYSKEAAKKQ